MSNMDIVPDPPEPFVEAAKLWESQRPNLNSVLDSWTDEDASRDLDMCRKTLTALKVVSSICLALTTGANKALAQMDALGPTEAQDGSSVCPFPVTSNSAIQTRMNHTQVMYVDVANEVRRMTRGLHHMLSCMTGMSSRLYPLISGLQNIQVDAQSGFRRNMSSRVKKKVTDELDRYYSAIKARKDEDEDGKSPLHNHLKQWMGKLHNSFLEATAQLSQGKKSMSEEDWSRAVDDMMSNKMMITVPQSVPDSLEASSSTMIETHVSHVMRNSGRVWVGYNDMKISYGQRITRELKRLVGQVREFVEFYRSTQDMDAVQIAQWTVMATRDLSLAPCLSEMDGVCQTAKIEREFRQHMTEGKQVSVLYESCGAGQSKPNEWGQQ